MSHNIFCPKSMGKIDHLAVNPEIDWIWEGYLARGWVTLLTSRWKSGKTTLVAGLLRQLATGGEFIGQSCVAVKCIVVSEESAAMWAARLSANPVGEHCELLARPFLRRPTPADWESFIDAAIEYRKAGKLDLFIVDPLITFLPGRSESDPGTLQSLLQPLQRLAETGVAVLVLHHPRKEKSEEGSSARGSGALLGMIDIGLELLMLGPGKANERRRRIVAISRRPETPRLTAYEWVSDTGPFVVVAEPFDPRFEENWSKLESVLKRRGRSGGTVEQLWKEWPDERDRPVQTTFLRWLNRGLDEKLVRRMGTGTKNDPYRYRLPNEDDEYWDRGELPPLRELLG